MKLIQKILLAQDFGKSSEGMLNTGIELASIFHSKVIPIHVLPDELANPKAKNLLEEAAKERLKKSVDQLKNAGLESGETILAAGAPHEKITQAAVEVNASLILIGSGEKQKNDKFLLGTTAKRIIQKSEKPVLVLKENASLNVQHILCPVDFSLSSKRALRNAITMAYRFKAELTVLFVCESYGSSWFNDSDTDLGQDTDCAGRVAKFDQFLNDFNLSGLEWNKITRKGNPAEEILNVISEKTIDLLVIGTTGRTGLNRLIIGSVTEKVIREVPCSFLTLKSEDVISLQLETDLKDIEEHYKVGMQLIEDGFYEEAIDQFKLCLSVNNMHVPSHYAIARVYEKWDQTELAQKHRDTAKDILDRIWYTKIEEEVRKSKRL